jgi:hypothetical protein
VWDWPVLPPVADDSIHVQKETTVSKWGNSLAVRIPQSAGRALYGQVVLEGRRPNRSRLARIYSGVIQPLIVFVATTMGISWEVARKRSSKRKLTKTPPRPKGYDFGSEATVLMVGSPGFMSALSRADIFACAYGYVYSKELQTGVPNISLVGSNGAQLAEAFREFQRWTNESQTEAVDLTLVFLEEGGYLLGVGPRPEALRRTLGYADCVRDPIFVSGAWIKKFDTTTSGENFRKYHEGHLVAPFVLSASTHPRSKSSLDADMNLIRPVPEAPDILKFRATFANEDNAEEHTQAGMIVRVHRADQQGPGAASGKIREKAPSRSNAPADYFRRRTLSLGRHFPVTIERIRKLHAHREVFQALEEIGIRSWQCEQAICNLLLSASMCSGVFHYMSVRKGQLNNEISAALQNRFEEADGSYVESLAPALLQAQVALDAASLLTESGASPKSDDPDLLQRLLAQRSLLDDSS